MSCVRTGFGLDVMCLRLGFSSVYACGGCLTQACLIPETFAAAEAHVLPQSDLDFQRKGCPANL